MELEEQLNLKKEEITLMKKREQENVIKHCQELESHVQLRKDKDASIVRLERLLSEREYDVNALSSRCKQFEQEISILTAKLES